jgi:Protein of unknown function (DUF3301)
MLEQLLLLLPVAGAVWLFFDGVRVRELALDIGRDYCANLGLQLLDETVSMQRLGVARAVDGRLRVRRRYGFEFTSDGEKRYRGELTMLGSKVAGVQVELHRVLH